MRHLLKIKFVDSRVNTHILASTSVPIYTHDGASAKFSTNSHETDNSAGCEEEGRNKEKGTKESEEGEDARRKEKMDGWKAF